MPSHDQPRITYFAKTNFRQERIPFGILPKDRLFHFYVIGKTGSRKTTLLETKLTQDIFFGLGVMPRGTGFANALNENVAYGNFLSNESANILGANFTSLPKIDLSARKELNSFSEDVSTSESTIIQLPPVDIGIVKDNKISEKRKGVIELHIFKSIYLLRNQILPNPKTWVNSWAESSNLFAEVAATLLPIGSGAKGFRYGVGSLINKTAGLTQG